MCGGWGEGIAVAGERDRIIPDTFLLVIGSTYPPCLPPLFRDASKKILNDPTKFLDSLLNYDKDNIPESVIKKVWGGPFHIYI